MKKPERIYDLIQKDLPPQPCWIGNGILPKRGILLVGGLEKIGKSWMNIEFGRALATGAPCFGFDHFYTEKCRVLMLEQEIGELGFQPRVAEVMKEEDEKYQDNFWYVSQEPELRLDTEDGKQAMFETLEAVQPNVVIIDPVANFHDYDENDNSQIGRLFNSLHKLRTAFEHNDMSFILSHHFKKPPSDDGRVKHDPLDRKNFRGAHRWLAAPDAIMTCHRNRELQTQWEAWELSCRMTLRHAAAPPDFRLTINRDDDRRVRLDGIKGQLMPLKEKPLPVTLKGEQQKMGFIGAE